jgi:hypothetical protein
VTGGLESAVLTLSRGLGGESGRIGRITLKIRKLPK